MQAVWSSGLWLCCGCCFFLPFLLLSSAFFFFFLRERQDILFLVCFHSQLQPFPDPTLMPTCLLERILPESSEHPSPAQPCGTGKTSSQLLRLSGSFHEISRCFKEKSQAKFLALPSLAFSLGLWFHMSLLPWLHLDAFKQMFYFMIFFLNFLHIRKFYTKFSIIHNKLVCHIQMWNNQMYFEGRSWKIVCGCERNRVFFNLL